MEAVCIAGLTGVAMAFPKAVAELITPLVPKFISESLQESKISSCCKKEVPEPEPEPASAPESDPAPVCKEVPQLERYLTTRIKKRVQTNENYIHIDWKEHEVPEKAMRCIHENMDNPDEYEKITNTCVKLLELFAMKSWRREEISRVRDRLMQVDSDLAEQIDMNLFSQCAFYEGRILLYR